MQVKTTAKPEKLLAQRENSLSMVAALFVLLIWVALPMAVTNKYYNITVTKAAVLWGITAVCLLSFVTVLLVYRFGEAKVLLRFETLLRSMSITDWAAVAFFLITFLSACFSRYPDVAWTGGGGRFDGFITNGCYVMIFLIISHYYKYKNWHGALFACVCVLLTAIGVLQFFGFDFLRLYPEGKDFYSTQFLTLIGNINVVSSFAGLCCVFFSFLYMKTREKLRWIYFTAAVSLFFLQVLAASDSGWVNIGAGLLFSLPFVFLSRRTVLGYGVLLFAFGLAGYLGYAVVPSNYGATLNQYWLVVAALGAVIVLFMLLIGKKITLRKSVAVILAFVLILLVIAAGFLAVEKLGDNQENKLLYEAREMLHGNFQDSFMTNRVYIWRTCFALIAQSPLIGTGPDTVSRLHDDVYQNEALSVFGVHIGKAHNEYIQYAVSIGILGLLAYLTLVISVLVRWSKKTYRKENSPQSFAAGCSVIAYLFQAIFNFSVPICAPFFWVFLAMAAQKKEET